MSEIALISARKSSLKSEASKGSKSARKALSLQDNPDRLLSSVQIGITLIGLLTGMFSGNKIATLLAQVLADAGLEYRLASGLAQTLIIIVVTFLSIVLGELVPKRIGMNSAEKVAMVMAGPMSFISKLAKPVVWLLSKSTSLIISLLGVKEQESKVTEEEIKSIIQEGTDMGEVLPVEQDIVGRVFTLGDLTVSSIMTLRSDIVWLERSMPRPRCASASSATSTRSTPWWTTTSTMWSVSCGSRTSWSTAANPTSHWRRCSRALPTSMRHERVQDPGGDEVTEGKPSARVR